MRQTVGKLPGVASLEFNLIEGTMTVQAAAGAVNEQAIEDAVRKAGLRVVALGAAGPTGVDEVAENWWGRHARTLLCWSSGLLVLSGCVTHAVTHGNLLHALAGGEGMEHHQFPLPVVVFYAAAVIAGTWFVVPKAWLALRRLRADMNLLMTLAVIGAMVIGQWFEAGTVAFLFALALLLESWSVARARRAIRALVGLTPPTARVICPCQGEIEEEAVSEVEPGATVIVRPGERIPLDGVITKGQTSVNQAPITGESMPVAKMVGDEVFAGTINEDGAIEFRTTKPAAETTLARIIRMVEQAQSRRAPVEQWVEKFARYYTPAMIALAVLVAVLPPLLGAPWGRWFYEALVMLVIACPCALVISTPVGIVAGLTSAAAAGVLVKGGVHLESLARIQAVAFDKTGTLTKGHPVVQEIVPLNGHTASEILARAAALEIHSKHPLAAAILRQARADHVASLTARNFLALKGRGAKATLDGRRYWVGSQRLAQDRGVADAQVYLCAHRMEDAGHSVVVVGNDRHVCGLISVADGVRAEAAAVVKALHADGVRHVVMLTGDNQGTAAAVGCAVGVDEVRAELLPEDKLQAIEGLLLIHGATAMVGDGVNDAPALASATVGIAMGAAGADAAIETADIALMSDDLLRLPWLMQHARRTLAIIQANIVFALGLKVIFLVLALAGAASLWMAIAADMGASLLVIINSLRLLQRRGLQA